MKTLQKEIYDHDSDIDVMHKINSIELVNWINHLKYIKKELANLIGLCTEDLNKQLDGEDLLEKFDKKHSENNTLLLSLLKYMNAREEIVECEDTKCDMVFITEHETYRHSYLYHLDKYRRLKDEFFSKVQGKFTLSNVNS